MPSLPQGFTFGWDFSKEFKVIVDFKDETWQVQSDLADCDIDIVSFNDFKFDFNYLCSFDDLNPKQRNEAEKVVQSFNEISCGDRLGRTDKITMTIDTGDAKPFKKKPFVMSPYMQKILNEELDEMLKLGVVESC